MLMKLDRVAMGVDAFLIAALLALGFLGDRVPLPKGQDTLLILRSVPDTAPVLPGPPAPALPPEPALPAPPAAAPPPPPKPEQLVWGKAMAAFERGKSQVGEARNAKGDAQKKRLAYTAAEKAFEEALAGIEAYRGVCPDPNPAVEDTVRDIRMLISECHKSKPLDVR